MNLARFGRILRQRMRSLLRAKRADAELAGELAFHLDQLVQENLAEGMPPEEARREARRSLGNLGLLEDQCRDERRVAWLGDLKQDLAYGWRMLRKSPGFTLVAVASLTLGIGANTAILGLADSMLFGKLPYRDPARLLMIRSVSMDAPAQYRNASLPEFFAVADGTRAFESMGCSLSDQRNLGALTAQAGGNEAAPERLIGQAWSPGLFETLGVKPFLGRGFVEADYHPGAPSAVVLSYRLWQKRFGGDPKVIGTRIRLNGAPAEVVGVMPPDFRFAEEPPDYWVPMQTVRTSLQAGVRYFIVAARLRDGVSLTQAQAELDQVSARLAAEFPDTHTDWSLRLQPVREALYGWTRLALLTLEAAVALVLLLACANVAGLLLARGASRRQEMAMRAALGAGRSRIVRQMLAESLLLSFIGGLLGAALAWAALTIVPPHISPPPNAPRLAAIPIDFRFLGHLLGLSVLISAAAGLMFTLTPALFAWREDLNAVLTESPRNSGPAAGRQHLRGVMIAGQIAIAFLLLMASGLVLKSFLKLAGRDLNFQPRGLLTMQYRLPVFEFEKIAGTYKGFPYMAVDATPAARFERILDRLRQLPQASSAAGISALPVNGLVVPEVAFTAEGFAEESGGAAYFLVTPRFFSAMGASVIRGRDIADGDTAGAPWVAVLNETAATRFWPGQDPLGKRFTLDTGTDDRPREVVGVVRDIPINTRESRATPVVYASFLQQPPRVRLPLATSFAQMVFMLRARGDEAALTRAAKQAVAEIDPETPLSTIAPMESYSDAGSAIVYYTLLLGGFSVLATALAAIGVYGVMSFHLAQRTHEIGIRMALGAQRWQVVCAIGGRAVAPMAAGLAAGAGAAAALTRYLAGQSWLGSLWQVTPADPAAYVGALAVLVLAAGLACAAPLRRSIRVSPAAVLRG